MKFNFKKVASILASGAMLASTIGFAAAATFPAPFDSGSAIVYGANGNVQVDMAAAVNIQTAIGTISGTEAGIPEGSWRVETSSDNLEIDESIRQVDTYIDKDSLPILADVEITNEKGTAKYEQFFYFDDQTTSRVTYQEDDNENIGLFFKIDSGRTIARYVMEFSNNLESDVATDSSYEDIEDEEIVMLGKTYTIITAVNTSAGVTDLTLMSGANKVIVSNGEELTVAGKTISVLVSATNEARFTVDGETTAKLAKGGTAKLDDGTYLGVSDITYQSFAGGIMQATAYVGADKIELKDGSNMVVNAETINEANVNISDTISGGDVSIDTITINMTAEDDLYVPEGGKLSAAADLDEPEVLITQNWDIVYSGLDDNEYTEIKLRKSTDSKIILDFENINGDEISLPLFFTNTSGVFGGQKEGYELILNASSNITKNQYFILNTADPTTAANANNARSYVVQYKGSDKSTDTNPKMKFNIIGVDNSKEVSLSSETSSLKLGGSTFTFNCSSTATVNDCDIRLTSSGYATYNTAPNVNGTLSNYIRTKNNVLINITDTNVSEANHSMITHVTDQSSDWTVKFQLDDTEADGDQYVLTTEKDIVLATYSNNSDGEFGTTFNGGNASSWISDPDDNTKSTYIDTYGVEVDYVNPSSAPASVTLKVPKSIVTPKVYVTSGAVTGGTTAAGGLAPIVADSAISTVQGSNLVVVGGSCINSVAAKLLGSDSPLCGADFTAKTTVGAGSYVIDTFASPYTAGKVAMLVAGYEAADTTAAAQKVVDDSLSPDASAAAVIGPVTA